MSTDVTTSSRLADLGDLADQLHDLAAVVDQLGTAIIAAPTTPKREVGFALDGMAGLIEELDLRLRRLTATLAYTADHPTRTTQ